MLQSVIVIECFTFSTGSRFGVSSVSGSSHIPAINRFVADRCRNRTEFLRLTSSSDADRRDRCSTARLLLRLLPRDAQSLFTGQPLHRGTPGRQTVAPSSIIAWLKSPG